MLFSNESYEHKNQNDTNSRHSKNGNKKLILRTLLHADHSHITLVCISIIFSYFIPKCNKINTTFLKQKHFKQKYANMQRAEQVQVVIKFSLE